MADCCLPDADLIFPDPGGERRLQRWYKCCLSAAPPLVAGATTFAPLGSMSLDFRVALLPYKSSSFATPLRGGKVGAWQRCQFELMAAAERKPYNRAGARGNAPLSPPAAVLPPEGEVLAALCLEVL